MRAFDLYCYCFKFLANELHFVVERLTNRLKLVYEECLMYSSPIIQGAITFTFQKGVFFTDFIKCSNVYICCSDDTYCLIA